MLIRKLSYIALLASIGAVGTAVYGQQASPIPEGPGLDLINERCVYCHTASQVLSTKKTPEEWADTVQLMIDRGAQLDPHEQEVMIDYLVENYGVQDESAS